jgi:hypothetical protein
MMVRHLVGKSESLNSVEVKMSRLLCKACEKSILKWVGEADLENGIMKCQKRTCGQEYHGMDAWINFVKPVKVKPGFNIGTALDAIKDMMGDNGTMGQELGMYVARDSNGKAVGIGTSFVSVIINTARVYTHSKEPYNMSYAGGH